MNIWVPIAATGGIILGGIMLATAGWDIPPVDSSQNGFRGTAMEQIRDREAVAALARANALPESLIATDTTGPKVRDLPDLYKNVQVLGDLTEDQFNTLMLNITTWVAPKEGDNAGCNYCHNPENMAEDAPYPKIVARRMIQMTRTINSEWKNHVAQTGVTCYTCHRGAPVPAYVWFNQPGTPKGNTGWMGWRNHQNQVARQAGLTSLPGNAEQTFLAANPGNIRMTTLTALPDPASRNPATTMSTEWTYALMVNMSEALGVNCTFCHNSRAFNDWAQGPAQRVTAWHGIRLARQLNVDYLEPLTSVFPKNRLGPLGDVAKIGCATCHNGVNKPLLGQSMLKDYIAELGGAPASQ